METYRPKAILTKVGRPYPGGDAGEALWTLKIKILYWSLK